jgi:hypothetical protein
MAASSSTPTPSSIRRSAFSRNSDALREPDPCFARPVSPHRNRAVGLTQASLPFEFSQRLDLARNRAFGRGVHRADDAQIDPLHRLETNTLQIVLDTDPVRTMHGVDVLLALTGSTASANL